MLPKYVARTLAALAILALSLPAWSQTVNTNNIQEDFTTSTTNFTWLSFNGACLTAGTGTDQQHLPGCLNDNYYQNQTQWGGQNGCLGTNLNSDGTCPSTQTADTSGNGALRLTNGNAGTASFSNGFNQNGAILSNFSFPVSNGIQITFKTVTYHGNSKGNGGGTGVDGHDGADGITFFLLDDSVVSQSWNTPLDSGAFGGSLGYTCSNTNNDPTVRSADSSVRGYDGIIGGYIGLGVDEFGNFLNPGDNTASGPGLQANRIGMRGAGSIAWKWLTNTYPNAYSSTWTTSQQATAVKNTCKSGYLMDYNGNYFTSPTTSNSTSKNQSNGVAVADYGMIKDAQGNGAYKVLTSTQLLALGGGIANESAATRSSANPIAYNVKITQDGKLSFSYAFGTGTWQPVITNVDISNSNGTIPRNVRFGFAGSDGGASNVHEILCFAAQPAETSGSSGGVNVYQNPTIKSNTQIFLANYFPSNWTGQLTAQTIGFNGTTVVANTTPSWDARCVLSGNDPSTGKCNSTNSTVSTVEDWQASDGRQILTWDPATKAPVAFEWSSFSTDEQGFYFGNNQDVLSFLRGDRTNEIGYVAADGSTGKNEFRTRVAVLGDIVDSSPTWVGPPQTYTNMDNWVDALYPPGSSAPATPPENSGQKYSEFQALYTAKQSGTDSSGAPTYTHGRLNVVYVGANDGFIHGFSAGSLDPYGNLVDDTTTPNTGYEVLAYMPSAVLQTIDNAKNSDSTTQPELDYPNTLYSHAWYVDATPGTGDLFYQCTSSTLANCQSGKGTWHTWLVGGLGAGGAGIYALDVTNPSSAYFKESNTAIVVGDWTPSNITCETPAGAANQTAACGSFLGNTYGTPLIRRFHNGSWGVIFGNGYNTSAGYAGIFIMLVDPSSGAKTFYYLPAGTATSSGNGIGPTTSADLDLDHIVDYIYAGDLKGNVWRFDVTSSDPSKWAVRSKAIFKTPSGQPITTALSVSTLKSIQTNFSLAGKVLDNKPEKVMINFGTGQQTPASLTNGTTYSSTQQALYGVWDWDLSSWNSHNPAPSQQVVSLSSGPQPIAFSSLVSKQFTTTTSGGAIYRTVNTTPPSDVCWPPTPGFANGPSNPVNGSGCSGTGTNYGWYMNLSTTNSLYEQVVFDPVVNSDGMFIVNTYIPTSNSPLNCTPGTSTGFTMALEPDSGYGAPPATGSSAHGYFVLNNGTLVDGIELNGIGTPSFISTGAQDGNQEFMLTQGPNGMATPTPINRHSVVAGQRLNWVQRR